MKDGKETVCFVIGDSDDPILSAENQIEWMHDVFRKLAESKPTRISKWVVETTTNRVVLQSAREDMAGRGYSHVFQIKRVRI